MKFMKDSFMNANFCLYQWKCWRAAVRRNVVVVVKFCQYTTGSFAVRTFPTLVTQTWYVYSASYSCLCALISPSTVPWWLGHPPFRHCDTSTPIIRHCNDSPHKRFHFMTIWPHRGRTVRPPPNRSVRPLKSGSKHSLWQSDPFLCSARQGGGGNSLDHDTEMALLKNAAAPPEITSPTHGSAERNPDLTLPQILQDPPNRTPPKHGSMVSSWVGSTIPRVRLGKCMRTTLHVAVVSHCQAGLIVTIKMACAGQIVTVTIRSLRNNPGQKSRV